MLLWKSHQRNLNRLFRKVSILVLLDVALKVSAFAFHHLPSDCFNPCSLGCCSESIYLVGDNYAWNKFQSLFSWMLLWKRRYRKLKSSCLRCFNPCSLGCCSERSTVVSITETLLKFQSLFSWMLLWKTLLTVPKHFGTQVSILVLLDVALKGRMEINRVVVYYGFQSLFSWMLLWKRDRRWSCWLIPP